MRFSVIAAASVFPFVLLAQTATTCRRISEVVVDPESTESDFVITCRVNALYAPEAGTCFSASDSSGAAQLFTNPSMRPERVRAGDTVLIRGYFDRRDDGIVYASCNGADILAHGEPDPVPEVSAEDIQTRRFDNLPVRITGTVIDTFPDEVDPHYLFLVLISGNTATYVSVSRPPDKTRETAEKLIGARVAVTGLCDPSPQPSRKRMGRIVQSLRLEVLQPADPDPFNVPELQDHGIDTPAEIALLGRRRAIGSVAAAWQGNTVLLRTQRNRYLKVGLKAGTPPSFGSVVEAVGQPETDLYRINLARAIWRPATNIVVFVQDPETPLAITARELMEDDSGREKFRYDLHGRTVRLGGRVIGLPGLGSEAGRLFLDCNGYIVAVDVSALPSGCGDIAIGCQVEITGACIMDGGVWNPGNVFPKIRSFFIVARTPEDLVVTARPPWWTAERLTGVVFSLLALLLGIGAWNFALHRLAERRGRQLAAGDIARAEADMRTFERTRLAVDLHDSVSQILTGAFMELETTKQFEQQAHPELIRHLGIAKQAVQSCRDELRNCLWDLRNQSLEEPTFDEAIRRTLLPHVSGVEVTIRFNVPRDRFTDTTAHAILQIVRELTVNAIRHGHARHIRIAGCIDGDRVLFSVSDDGVGFDPDSAPGILSGHFGLQGIRERIGRFSGQLEIASRPGEGTRASVSIRIHQG